MTEGDVLCSQGMGMLLGPELLHVHDVETEEGRAERKGGSLKGWKGTPHPLSEKYISIKNSILS